MLIGNNSSRKRRQSTTLLVEHDESNTPPLMSREDVEVMIADGHQLIIFHQHVLKVDKWLSYHPGGSKSISHMVGRDATDEIEVLHSQAAKKQMLRYRIGRVEGTWKNFKAPIQGGSFRTAKQMGRYQGDCSNETTSEHDLISPISPEPSTLLDVGGSRFLHRQIVAEQLEKEPESISRSSNPELPIDGMTYLDYLTREHITLDLEKYPAVNAATQARVVTKYRELHQKVMEAGLYKTNYGAYSVECCRYVLCFLMMFAALSWGHYAVAGLFLGAMWHQLVFTAHDAGHMGITHDYHTDTLIGIFVADFVGGLSLGWWKHNHNVHHIMTNAPEHDPDIEHMPIFAVSHRLLGNLRSTFYDRVMKYDRVAKVLLRIQPWTYYPLLAFGRFNLYILSWDYLLTGRGPRKGAAAWHRWVELVGQLFFWTWFGYGILYKMIPDGWSRFNFVMVSHIASSPLHLQIVLSHFAMSTTDLGPQESFAQKMLRTTMDIDCPPWLDFLHGGLQFQAIHHLFPRMPRHNLRKAQKYVQIFCQEVDIPYAYYGFAKGNREVIGKLAEVSRQAAILAKCQQTITQNGYLTGHTY